MDSDRFHPVIVLAMVLFNQISAETNCDGKDGFRCCSGYKWNEEYDNCSKCLPGYYGLECTQVCPYPTYGEKCKMKCSCIAKICHFAIGCIQNIDPSKDILKTSYRTSIEQSTEYKKDKLMITTDRISTFKYLNNTVSSLIPQNFVISEKYHRKDKNYNSFQFVMQVCVVAMLVFLIVLVLTHYIKKFTRRLRTNRIPTYKQGDVSNESDQYHSLENIEQTFPFITDEDLIFDGLAEVKIKFDSGKKKYTIGFQTKTTDQECKSLKPINTTKMNDGCTDSASSDAFIYVPPKNTEEQSPLISQFEMDSKGESMDNANPYLLVVQDT